MNIEESERLIRICEYENRYYKEGYNTICGIDEVGRGPLAGPVIAACVILPRDTVIEGINDSKKISKKKHEFFYSTIIKKCIEFAIGIVDEKEIDDINILQATKKAMSIAVNKLKTKPDVLFIDHLNLADISIEQLSLSKGDSLSISIAAASLIAKYTRDEMMKEYSLIYPEYGFDKNAGYGTRSHIKAIKKYGLCDIHRRSFVKKIISKF